ncbi:hypothetical protein [Streptomyces lydicus]|uniref:hypothetical protein n=1 Tax=Streptomyces lydicus TaxID=47763 RepID=UPI0037A5316E
MNDPDSPAGWALGGEGSISYGAAREQVGLVAAWYAEQLMSERRAGADEDRMDQLKAEQLTVLADQRALEDAEPEEVARIAALYRARYNELTGQ